MLNFLILIILIFMLFNNISTSKTETTIEILTNHREIFTKNLEGDKFYTELLNHFYMIYLCKNRLDQDFYNSLVLDMKHAFFTMPELNNHYHKNKVFYCKKFHSFVTDLMAKESKTKWI